MPLKAGSKAQHCGIGECKKRYYSKGTLEDHIRTAHPKTKQAKALGPVKKSAPKNTSPRKSTKSAGRKVVRKKSRTS